MVDAKEVLKDFKMALEADKKELEQLDILIGVAEKAGENVLDQKREQARLKSKIANYEKALKGF